MSMYATYADQQMSEKELYQRYFGYHETCWSSRTFPSGSTTARTLIAAPGVGRRLVIHTISAIVDTLDYDNGKRTKLQDGDGNNIIIIANCGDSNLLWLPRYLILPENKALLRKDDNVNSKTTIYIKGWSENV